MEVRFLVIESTWKLFCQTGNIEAYLLYKELEGEPQRDKHEQDNWKHGSTSTNDEI